ncbi:DUF4129 domain-containing protein [Accumulibacter sp.]|uniref:DUF4129 domain-containing protein n=1 Tax=Accumulibacter sp. TaxID=2053492 RepID=UPI002625725F|nr:DUF4129 domain-containing protein [Accumulibacter sp.]
MQLEQIAIRLRRRSPWEALDLGHAMLHAWAPRVYAAWFATYWPAGIVVVLLLWPWPEYAMLLLWWLKPLFDRVLLLVFSRSLFGAECGVRHVWRELPRLWRGAGVLSGLSLRRGSLARSFLLPVWQLEEQRGAGACARCRLLARRYRGYAAWLTFFGANMSLVLLLALLALLFLLAPGDSQAASLWDWLSDDTSSAGGVAECLMFMLAETLVEPLYVASGFSLYLNRRSELEAWDVELGLRRLAERRSRVAPAAGWLLAAAVVAWPGLAPPPVHAAEPPALCSPADAAPDAEVAGDDGEEGEGGDAPADGAAAGPAPGAARDAIDAVLADPVFGGQREDWVWRWREPAEEPPADDSRRGWLAALGRAIEFLAEVLRVLVWIVAGAGLALAAFFLIRRRERQAATTPRGGVDFLSGLDLRPGSLPPDVAAAARAALAAGRLTEALSLLYRGALVALIEAHQVEFAPGDSEGDCLSRIAGRLPEAAERCFGEVVEAWRQVAYGRRSLAAPRVAQLVADWERHFRRAGVAA